jgi:cytochrome c peroxidase
MSAAQVRGMNVFFDQAKCDACHEGVNSLSGEGWQHIKPPEKFSQ